MNQMRGGFTGEIRKLREKLLTFTSLVELELDFSEEDVEFADRGQLRDLLTEITGKLESLSRSFVLGNVIKNGIPVAIVGRTNVGKSTLLNLLVSEEKAIVSEIAGTTRDSIEDVIGIRGVHFRLIDTAGLRHTEDVIEKLGIERTWQKIDQAAVIIQVLDTHSQPEEITMLAEQMKAASGAGDKHRIVVLNKMDRIAAGKLEKMQATLRLLLRPGERLIPLAAKSGHNLGLLEDALLEVSGFSDAGENEVIITNVRHFEALEKAFAAMKRASEGLNSGLPGDLLAQDIREAIHYLGEITGEITNDEVLGNIFKNFCIGK
jgi:tRNA modification GTPase